MNKQNRIDTSEFLKIPICEKRPDNAALLLLNYNIDIYYEIIIIVVITIIMI